MTEAALMSFEFGFESTVLPFDLNVEAEILGAKVRYHEGFDGHPVYPTIADKPVTTDDDIKIPNCRAFQLDEYPCPVSDRGFPADISDEKDLAFGRNGL